MIGIRGLFHSRVPSKPSLRDLVPAWQPTRPAFETRVQAVTLPREAWDNLDAGMPIDTDLRRVSLS